jgi:pentatricopeptide repeat protein
MMMLADSPILSQVIDFFIAARAEIFLFVVAIVAHLLLFGNVFPRRAVRGQKKKAIEEDDAPEEAEKKRPTRNVVDIPDKAHECERCLQRAYEDGDYRTVLRCWSQLKKFDEEPSVNLGQVVEAMQRFKKDSGSILVELRGFLKKHQDTLDRSVVNELLESLTKSLDTELAQKIADMVQQIGLEPDSRMYDILLSGYFAARDFQGVHATHAEMKAQKIAISGRANAVLLKTALRMNNLAESLHYFRTLRRLGDDSGLLEGRGTFFSQILDLACKEHQLRALDKDLEGLALSPEMIHKIFAECASTKDMDMMAKVNKLARSQGVQFSDRTYQVLIKAAGNDHSQVIELFNEIVARKVEMSGEVASAVLAACASQQDAALATSLADRIFEHTKPGQMPVLCALIRYYSDAGLHEKACQVYEKHMQQQGASSVNRCLLDARTERAVMNSLTKCGRETMAKGILDATPTNVAKHINMIRDCASKKNLEGAFSVFNTLKNGGADLTRSMHNAVLDACVECQDLPRATKWMQEMKENKLTDVVSYNTMVKAFVRADKFDKAQVLLSEMKKEGLDPNHVTYNEFINGLVRTGSRKQEVWKMVDEMQAQGVKPNRVTCSILLKDLKARSHGSDVTRTMELITGLSEPMDEVLLSSVVEACVRVGKPDLLTTKLAQITQDHHFVTGAHTFGSLIKAYGHAKDVNGAWRCWKEMRTRHISPTSITIGCMVEAVVSNGDSEGGYELIKQMQEDDQCRDQVNAVIYCSVIKGFAHEKKMERVWSVWNDMLQSKVTPSITTYNALIDGCARNGGMDRVPQLLTDMKNQGLKANLITYSTVLKGHCIHGDIRTAFDVLDQMCTQTDLKPDEIMYNTLLDGCAQSNLADEGLRLLTRMQNEGIRPSNYTLSILVKLASHARRLDQAFQLVDELTKKYRFKPNAPVYGNLIQACLSNKELPKALEVLERMAQDKVHPEMRAIGSVIRACISYGYFDHCGFVLRGALGLPCTAKYPSASDKASIKGLEDLTNEVLASLASRGHVKDLAAPLLSDVRQYKPNFRIESSVQRKIALGL